MSNSKFKTLLDELNLIRNVDLIDLKNGDPQDTIVDYIKLVKVIKQTVLHARSLASGDIDNMRLDVVCVELSNAIVWYKRRADKLFDLSDIDDAFSISHSYESSVDNDILRDVNKNFSSIYDNVDFGLIVNRSRKRYQLKPICVKSRLIDCTRTGSKVTYNGIVFDDYDLMFK